MENPRESQSENPRVTLAENSSSIQLEPARGENDTNRLLHYAVRRAMAVVLLLFAATSQSGLAQEPPTRQQAVERVLIQYTDGDFSLLERRAFRKVIPPSDELPGGERLNSGFWFEVQGPTGSVLYRRIVGNPLIKTFEGPDIDTPDSVVPDRKESVAESKTLSILIPAPLPESFLVFFSSPLEPGAQAEAATEIGRVALLPIIQ